MAIYLTVLLSILNQISIKGSKMLVALHALELGASPFAIGILVSAYAVCPLALAVYAGRVSDRRGVRLPMLLGSAGMALGLILPFAMPTLAVLFVCSALIGACSLFYHVSAHNLVGALGEGAERTRNFGTFSLGASLASFAGPLTVGFGIDHWGYLPCYALLAAIAIVPAAVLLGYSRFIPRRVAAIREAKRGSLADLLGSPELRRTFFAAGLILTGLDLFNFYMPIYGRSIGLSASSIGVVLGMQAAAAFVVRLWMPRIAKAYGELQVMTASMFMAGATYLLFPMVHNAILLGTLAFVLGLGLGCAQPLSIILTYNHSPPGRAGEALGLRLTFNKLTQTLVPLVFGSLGTLAGMSPVFWMNAALLLSGGLLSCGREKRAAPHARSTE